MATQIVSVPAAGKGTIRLRPEDAARIPDQELQDLVRAALRA